MEGLRLALLCAERLWLWNGLVSLGTIVQANRMGQEGKEKARVHTSSFKIRLSPPKGRASFFIVEISSGQFWEQGGLNQKAIKSPSYPSMGTTRYFAHELPLGFSLFWPLGEQSLPSGDPHPPGCSQSKEEAVDPVLCAAL